MREETPLEAQEEDGRVTVKMHIENYSCFVQSDKSPCQPIFNNCTVLDIVTYKHLVTLLHVSASSPAILREVCNKEKYSNF